MADKSASACPVDHSKFTTPPPSTSTSAAASCPVDHSKYTKAKPAATIDHEHINPDNMMPHLTQQMAPGQSMPLPTDRTLSSIPKGTVAEASKTKEVWEYPSPQQFYNALKRKGWETPEKEVPVMVQIHNFLNEECWTELLKWENKYHCDCSNPTLVKFRGRPQDMSPKARIMTTFFGAEKPFDRHDWTIDRCGTQVRYVIDYYGAPVEEGNPVFYVDVRPALDSPVAFVDRARETIDRFATSAWNRFFAPRPEAPSPSTSSSSS